MSEREWTDAEIIDWTLKMGDISPTVSLERTRILYPKSWVLMRVTAFDIVSKNPSHGFVLASGLRESISSVLSKEPPPLEQPSEFMPYLVFHTSSAPMTDRAWRLLEVFRNRIRTEGR